MSGAMSRRKGAVAERDVVRWLRANGYPDARRYLAGDGRQPGDIDGVPGMVIEVKNHRRPAIKSWLRQLDDEGGDHLFKLLIMKIAGRTDVGTWSAIWRTDTDHDVATVAVFFDAWRTTEEPPT